MAAYSAVVSLLQTLDQRNPELFHDHTVQTLDFIHATAEYFQQVLEKISKNSRFDHEKIKSLEEKIRVAASDAEDVVELKIRQIIKESSWTFGILQHQDLLPLVEKMDATKKQVTEILSHDNDADQILEVSRDSLIDIPSTSYPMLSDQSKDDIVHGLDDDLEIIIKRLTGPPSDLDIVTITGMGGIGKTTLARKAYDQLRIRYHHFDILAWVTISQEFRGRNVFLEALRCISKLTDFKAKDYDKMDDNELADLVQKRLKGPRYLVIVDDIWSRDDWDSIRGIFPNYNNGSRVLMTTRETEVAMYANACRPHEMSVLNLENGWKLLCDKVFGAKHDHPPELEEVGKEIVEKCQGLPLTISVIGGHLSNIPRTLGSWKDVARNLSEIIASNPNKCLGILGLSYYHLPNRLKPCFLSMSSFPEDFQVDTQRLIQLWIAEGFVRTSAESCKSLEEVAIDYLEDLISRNLIQARKRRFNGEIKACGIHDLLREFCLIEAEMTNHMHVEKNQIKTSGIHELLLEFCLTKAEMTEHMHVERTHPTFPTQKHNARRFSFQTGNYLVDYCHKLLPPVSRSIYVFSHLDPIAREFFYSFKLLRVLAIFDIDKDLYVDFSSFPLVITKLFHLRYLQLPFYVNIPESISELQNLQYLIHSGIASDKTLPMKIWTMENLRYIRLDGSNYLPIRIGESTLNYLEEFSGLCSTSCTKEDFSGIPNLKRLIICEPFGNNNCSPNGLMDMSSLRKLEAFKCYCLLDYPQDLIKSSVIPISLKDFVFPTSLKRLSLNRCLNFIWEDLSSTVIILLNLEELKLKDCRADDDVWILTDQDKFKSLKLLLLSGLNLECWKASSDNFPNLKRLVLKNCDYLLEIPTDFGEIGTLESIELQDCSISAEKSARNIEQEQDDMGNNFLKVYIHNYYANYYDWDEAYFEAEPLSL